MGSVTAFDEGHCSFEPICHGSHTIFDIVNRFSKKGRDIDHAARHDMLSYLESQINGIENAWHEVVAGYAALQSITIPVLGLSKELIYTRNDESEKRN